MILSSFDNFFDYKNYKTYIQEVIETWEPDQGLWCLPQIQKLPGQIPTKLAIITRTIEV